jgi:hypothetical protein
MFKTYHRKRPEYSIWQYDGEEVIPDVVAKKLAQFGYSFKVVTFQKSSNGISTIVDRHLEIKGKSYVETVVEEGHYLVFTEYYPGVWPEVDVVKTLEDYEEAP